MSDTNARSVALRLKITDACNFNCYFCHKEGDVSGKTMIPDDISTIVRSIAGASYIRKFGLTGGEPFLNPHLPEIIKLLSTTGKEVTITTNGSHIDRWMDILKQENVKIGVSFHHINANKFEQITKSKDFQKVVDNIKKAKSAGILSKINIAVMDYNKDALPEILTWIDENIGAVKVSVFNIVGQTQDEIIGTWKNISLECKPSQQIFKSCQSCPLLKKCEGCESIRVSKTEKGFVVFVCPLGKEPRIHVKTELELGNAIQTFWEEIL